MEGLIEKKQIIARIQEIYSQVRELLEEKYLREEFLTVCKKQLEYQNIELTPMSLPEQIKEWENLYRDTQYRQMIVEKWGGLKTNWDKIRHILFIFQRELQVVEISKLAAEMDGCSDWRSHRATIDPILTYYVRKGVLKRIDYGPRKITYRLINYEYRRQKPGPKTEY